MAVLGSLLQLLEAEQVALSQSKILPWGLIFICFHRQEIE